MYNIFCRIADIFFSVIALLILSPLFLILAFLLKFTGEGKIFYLQPRVGYKNKMFKIWKFATMLKNSPSMGTGDITIANDSRVLPMGKFLRKTKLNELPQLINVLSGDMSFVGARPLMQQSFQQYSEKVKQAIYCTRPGITGIGSVVFRNEELIIAQSNMEPRYFYETYILPHKGNLEIWYQENKSFLTDCTILFLTCWHIIFPNSQLVKKMFPTLPEMKKY
jgi:lipopolysaccharide/colanic/teichoic acid biosynthesis glycosyltransferase